MLARSCVYGERDVAFNFHQIDAFSDQPFAGNPAIVYPLSEWLEAPLMQRIAAEHNLAETAFVVGAGSRWHIRWFTPQTEVPLCGHATLAAAKVLLDIEGVDANELVFASLGGELRVRRAGALLQLDFPSRPVEAVTPAIREQVADALGQALEDVLALTEGGQIQELMAVMADESSLRTLAPDLAAIAALPGLGLVVTAAGRESDFVSRYFAPAIGINEDPVTGSTHCMLAPYWAERLGSSVLNAQQCSARGGHVRCEVKGTRVLLAGHARHVASGQLLLD